jgi:hypothetical protein
VDVSLEYELQSSRPAVCMTTVVDLWAAIHQRQQFVQRIGTEGGVSAATLLNSESYPAKLYGASP